MPISHVVDHDAQQVRITASGVCRLEDLVALLATIAAAGAFGYAQRFDARAVTTLPSSDETRRVVALVARLRAEHGHARTACITTSDVAFGMGRMYATLSAETDPGFMVFRNAEEADAWLGISSESRSLESPLGY